MTPLLGGAFIGALANRFHPARMIAFSVGLATVVNASLVPIAVAGDIAVWHLAAASLVAGIALAVDFTIRRPLLGSVVAPSLIGRAVSMDFVPNTIARVISPAATGLLIEVWGFQALFIAGATVYGLALVGAIGLGGGDLSIPNGGAERSPIKEGYTFARGKPSIMEVLGITAVMNLFVFPYRHFVPVIGATALGLSVSQVGLLTASEGIGMTIGAVALVLKVRPTHFSRILKGGLAVSAVGAIVFGLSSSVAISVAAVVAVGVGVSLFATMQSAIVVADVPSALRSRVMGLVGSLIGTNPVGLLLLGGLASLFGPAGAVITSGSIGFGMATMAASRARKRLVSEVG